MQIDMGETSDVGETREVLSWVSDMGETRDVTLKLFFRIVSLPYSPDFSWSLSMFLD
jgi:hypothetical protein